MLHIKNLHLSFYNEPTVGANAQGALQQLLAGLGASTQTNAAAPSAPTPVATTTALTPPAPGQPWPGQGGIYICTLPAQFGLPARHLVLGTNEAENLQWGGYGEEATGATSQTDGRANTAALVASATDHPAAQWAAAYTEDGHADYYLPSRIELLMCYLHAPQVFKTSGWYWSSSQYARGNAWCQAFECGHSYAIIKGSEFRARPVRSIQLQPSST
ncbi:DUF1566 domain-containing protein [Acidovorax sp. ACV01]|uniref:DUF1566 domain-containing protein n=1 Tax=Acidovorax sp. ACV01 TaxID=2769311 RepID=UPI00178577CF|nr:DUF1566 domain-containing protein [Acidovorax sp. ACV01]MBD9395172.1 DUF1566 domain-containing protein [Acidovorax sp. ACV01]